MNIKAPIEEPWIKATMVAQYLGISRDTVKRKADAGIFPCVRLLDGMYLFRLSELNAVLEKSRIKRENSEGVVEKKQ